MIESCGNCPDHGMVFAIGSESVMAVRCPDCGCMIPATTWYGISGGQAFEIEPEPRAA